MVDSADKPASLVLIDELFEAGDDRFVDELFACTADKKLKALAKKWYADERPWARRALLRYVDDVSGLRIVARGVLRLKLVGRRRLDIMDLTAITGPYSIGDEAF